MTWQKAGQLFPFQTEAEDGEQVVVCPNPESLRGGEGSAPADWCRGAGEQEIVAAAPSPDSRLRGPWERAGGEGLLHLEGVSGDGAVSLAPRQGLGDGEVAGPGMTPAYHAPPATTRPTPPEVALLPGRRGGVSPLFVPGTRACSRSGAAAARPAPRPGRWCGCRWRRG